MDLVTVIGICGTAAKLIAKISSGVNGVLDAPKSVQELSNELSAVFETWAKDFELVLKDCDDAFGRLEELVEKARTKKKETIKLGVVKRIDHQQDEMDKKIRAIHAAVEKLHQDRQNIKETFLVLETDRVEELEAALHDMEVVNHRLREEYLANSLEQSRETGVLKSALENLEAEYKNLEEELEAVVQAHELTQEQLAETVKEKLDLSERLSSSDSENTLPNDKITGIEQKNKA
ncbi:uncharacterized protein PAC_14262 [Phialocephala subalpina]|uniref:Uncharacterized protein n=1 Tax=Phialocephala subalpina TaxID=576137 RepID=A0A1L7XH56_9HELO|nr:uncharacterized protein PAC_14262 [Phialocephala subalpina]